MQVLTDTLEVSPVWMKCCWSIWFTAVLVSLSEVASIYCLHVVPLLLYLCIIGHLSEGWMALTQYRLLRKLNMIAVWGGCGV